MRWLTAKEEQRGISSRNVQYDEVNFNRQTMYDESIMSCSFLKNTMMRPSLYFLFIANYSFLIVVKIFCNVARKARRRSVCAVLPLVTLHTERL